jgi:hypothetical protein
MFLFRILCLRVGLATLSEQNMFLILPKYCCVVRCRNYVSYQLKLCNLDCQLKCVYRKLMNQLISYTSFILCSAKIQQNRNDETSEKLLEALKAEKEELEATLSREQLQTVQLKEEIVQAETRNAELTKASHLSLTLYSLCSLIVVVGRTKSSSPNDNKKGMEGVGH